MKAIKQAACAFVLAAAVSPALASPIVLDHSPQALGTDVYYNILSNWYVPNSQGYQIFAQAFSLAETALLDGADLYSRSSSGQVGNKARVIIWGDGGSSPGPVLAQFPVALTAVDGDGASVGNRRKHVDFGGFTVQAGSTYWISVAGDNTDLSQTVMENSGNQRMLMTHGDGFYEIGNYQLPFRLYGEVQASSDVPEPASLALFGLGMAGLACLRRKRQA
jgi:hypothetical protein